MEEELYTHEKFIFGTVFVLANKLQTIGDKFLEEITTKQWFLLVMVDQFKDEPPTLGEVANLLGTSHQNTKQLALKLENKGYLEINKDENDQRALRLKLTDSCYEYFIQRFDKDNEFLGKLYQSFSKEELVSFAKNVYKLTQAISDMDDSIKRNEFGWMKTLFADRKDVEK